MAEKYLSDKHVGERLGVHPKTPWAWARAGKFPKPIKLSEKVTRWRLSDVEAWEAEREKEVA